MQSKLLHQNGDLRTYVIVFDPGEEFISKFTEFAQKNNINGAHFTAIGAFQNITLEYFRRDTKDYKKIPVNEQVEVLALVGNVALKEKKSYIHAHVVLGKDDGTAVGGHIADAVVWPTLEVVLEESPSYMKRTMNESIGLALIDINA